jgi:hypothetical protein
VAVGKGVSEATLGSLRLSGRGHEPASGVMERAARLRMPLGVVCAPLLKVGARIDQCDHREQRDGAHDERATMDRHDVRSSHTFVRIGRIRKQDVGGTLQVPSWTFTMDAYRAKAARRLLAGRMIHCVGRGRFTTGVVRTGREA